MWSESQEVRTKASPGREEILKTLRENRALLDTFGVSRLSLFGSFARDEGREDSDVDLLVEFGRPIGLFQFVRLQRELGERLGRPVELVTLAALKPQLRDRILGEAVVAA
jgi:predicted nucleotidyltransferase